MRQTDSREAEDSVYKSGERSDLWLKMRINSGQEFVIGGYTIGGTAFDAIIFGYYEEGSLMYAARTRNGFTPAIRQSLAGKFGGLKTEKCPFANLPEKHGGRWGQGLTAAKMKDCVWLKPTLCRAIRVRRVDTRQSFAALEIYGLA